MLLSALAHAVVAGVGGWMLVTGASCDPAPPTPLVLHEVTLLPRLMSPPSLMSRLPVASGAQAPRAVLPTGSASPRARAQAVPPSRRAFARSGAVESRFTGSVDASPAQNPPPSPTAVRSGASPDRPQACDPPIATAAIAPVAPVEVPRTAVRPLACASPTAAPPQPVVSVRPAVAPVTTPASAQASAALPESPRGPSEAPRGMASGEALAVSTGHERAGGLPSGSADAARPAGRSTGEGSGESVPRNGGAGEASHPPSEGPSDAPPGFLGGPSPHYPARARDEQRQGGVRVRVHVNAEGQVDAVELDGSSGHSDLDAAARETAWSWRFRPAVRVGRPVGCWVRRTVVFRLE